jgi:shikimate 5-dehydrogenase
MQRSTPRGATVDPTLILFDPGVSPQAKALLIACGSAGQKVVDGQYVDAPHTAEEAAEWFGVKPATIRRWQAEVDAWLTR